MRIKPNVLSYVLSQIASVICLITSTLSAQGLAPLTEHATPTLISCTAPPNVTVTCETFNPALSIYGFATSDPVSCLDTITEMRNYALFDSVCNRGQITRTFRAIDCAGLFGQCTQSITVTYNQDYYVHLPQDYILGDCNVNGNYGQPIIFDEDCEKVHSTYTDDIVPNANGACFVIYRKWKVSNDCMYNQNLPCLQIPNPRPNAILNHPSNLNAPALKVTPHAANNLSVPIEMRSTLISITPGSPETDYSLFWQANANCYEYIQQITVLDYAQPVIDACTQTPLTFGDVSPNDGQIWRDSLFNDPIHNTHDLCETPVDLSVTASDLCAGTNIQIRYILFLDANNSGDMETVINSAAPPAYGFVNIGNAGNPNYAGGTPVRFDKRPVPTDQVWRFGMEITDVNGKRTARIGLNTAATPNDYVLPQLPHGMHKIKWFVQDACGNESTCEQVFTIRDTKSPTVVCISGISANIMPTGMIPMWDTDLLQYTIDNCTPDSLMALANKTAICANCTNFPLDAQGNPIKVISYSCNQIGTNSVRIWSRDAAGNTAFCDTYVLVQDNNGNCPGGNPTNAISGTIRALNKSGNVLPIPNVSVTLSVSGGTPVPGWSVSTLTDSNGAYGFGTNVLPASVQATITPIKDGDHLNGVEMLDVLKIQRHILGLEPLPSPYRQIAADVNNTGSITASDIVEMRKLILGSYTKFPNVNSWRFVDKAYAFPNPNNAFVPKYPETITLNTLSPAGEYHFEAIKMGDVTGNFSSFLSAEDRAPLTAHIDVQDQELNAGQTYSIGFTPQAIDALQLTLQLDGLEMISTDLDDMYFAVHNEAMTLAMEKPKTFSIQVQAQRSGNLSQMLSVNSSITQAAAFRADERMEVSLRFKQSNAAKTSFTLYQNAPNPFAERTVIGFDLPKATRATLSVFDALGRTLYTSTSDYLAGNQTVEVTNLDTKGMLFYTLTTDQGSKTMQMLRVE
jgi:hypothetical protein